jgi:tetratricopeptide (TPR) repeat protein
MAKNKSKIKIDFKESTTDVEDIQQIQNPNSRQFAQKLTQFSCSFDVDTQCQEAEDLYIDSIHLLDELSNGSQSKVNILSVAEMALHQGRQLFQLERFAKAKLAFVRAVKIYDSLVLLDANAQCLSQLAIAVTWQSRALRKSGKIEESIQSYDRAIGLLKTLGSLSGNPDQRLEHRLLLGSNLLGLSKSLKENGELDLSKLIAAESYDILGTVLGHAPLSN